MASAALYAILGVMGRHSPTTLVIIGGRKQETGSAVNRSVVLQANRELQEERTQREREQREVFTPQISKT